MWAVAFFWGRSIVEKQTRSHNRGAQTQLNLEDHLPSSLFTAARSSQEQIGEDSGGGERAAVHIETSIRYDRNPNPAV